MGIISRFLRPTAEGPEFRTPSEVNQKLNEHEARIGSTETIDQQQNAVLDDHAARINTDTARNDQQDAQITQVNGRVDNLTAQLPDYIDGRIEGYFAANFVPLADEWSKGFDITAKADDWWAKKDIHDKLSQTMLLPSGIIPEDVGVLLGIVQRLGSRVKPAGTITIPGISSPSLPGATPGAAGVIRSGFTIPNADVLETRLQALASDWYGPLGFIGTQWSATVFPAIADTINQRGGWQSTTDYITGRKVSIENLMAGKMTAALAGEVDSRINTKFVTLQKSIGAQALDADQRGAIAVLIAASPSLGNTKPVDQLVGALASWYDDVKPSGSLSVAIDGRITSKFPSEFTKQWGDFTVPGGRFDDAFDGKLGRADMMNPNDLLRGQMSSWWEIVGSFPSNLDAALTPIEFGGTSPWQSLKDHMLEFKDIKTTRDGFKTMKTKVTTIKDRVAVMQKCIGDSKTKLSVANLNVTNRLGDLRDDIGALSLNDWAIAVLGGGAGAVIVLASRIQKIADALLSVGDPMHIMNNDLNCLDTQLGNLSKDFGDLADNLPFKGPSA